MQHWQQREAEADQWHSVEPLRAGPATSPHRTWQRPAGDSRDQPSQQQAQHVRAATIASTASELAAKARETAQAIEDAARRRRADNAIVRCVRCDLRFPAECCPPALLQQPLPAARCPACLRAAGMEAYYPLEYDDEYYGDERSESRSPLAGAVAFSGAARE